MEQRETFEAVAELYGEARPGYPAALYDDLEALAGLGPTARVLEVGCGAGQATGDLAARAAHVTALDPGERLVAEARRRADRANVDYVVARFEDFAPEPGAYDLVASAQAWHWVDPAVRFQKAAAALREGGSIAIFGHTSLLPPEPFREAFRQIYERHLPGVWGTPPSTAAYLPTGPFAAMIDQSGLFGPVTHRGYAWTWTVTGEAFGRYLRTDSSYRPVPEERRFALFDDLSAAIADLGGRMDSPWETHLYVARRR